MDQHAHLHCALSTPLSISMVQYNTNISKDPYQNILHLEFFREIFILAVFINIKYVTILILSFISKYYLCTLRQLAPHKKNPPHQNAHGELNDRNNNAN